MNTPAEEKCFFCSKIIYAILEYPKIIIFSVFSLWLLWNIVMYYPGTPTLDTYGQLLQGTSGELTNWKPAIYSFLLGVLEKEWEGSALKIAYLFQLVGMGLGCVGIAYAYSCKSRIYALLIFVLPIFFTEKCIGINTVGNDAAAATCYLIYIAGILLACEKKIKKWLIFISLLFLLFGLHLRHNSIFAVIVLLAWGVYKVRMDGVRKRILVSIALSCVMLVVNATIINCLDVKKTYPLKFGLAADLVNLSIIDGQWSEICNKRAVKEFPLPHKFSPLRACVPNVGTPINPYETLSDPEAEKLSYEELKREWLKEVCKSPHRYLLLKCLFFEQFLFCGIHVPVVCDVVKGMYPHVNVHMTEESSNWRSWINRKRLSCSMIPMILYFFLIVTFTRCCMVKDGYAWLRNRSLECKDLLFFLAASFTYTFTFFPVVFSATEFRFYIIRGALCSLVAVMMCLIIVRKILKNISPAFKDYQ